MAVKNTLYRLVPDFFNTSDIETVVEREQGALFFDEELKILYTWIDGVKINIAQPVVGVIAVGTVAIRVVGNEYIIETLSPVDYMLPLISELDITNFFLDIKNLSGEDLKVLPDGTDLIDGETEQTIPNDSNMRLYVSGAQYRIL